MKEGGRDGRGEGNGGKSGGEGGERAPAEAVKEELIIGMEAHAPSGRVVIQVDAVEKGLTGVSLHVKARAGGVVAARRTHAVHCLRDVKEHTLHARVGDLVLPRVGVAVGARAGTVEDAPGCLAQQQLALQSTLTD